MYYWDDIVGNGQLKKTLKKSAESRKFSHAYLIEGPSGSGKKLIANTFAKAIFCKGKEKDCNCHSCVSFDALSHSDLVYLRPEKTKTIGVDALRSKIVNDVSKTPFEYDNKIYIIENADMMTIQAQNALLRSLEEPPEYVMFILLSRNIHNFLPTIISRCFICGIHPLKAEEVRGYFKTSDDRVRIACEYSRGSIGEAIRIYEDDGFFQMRDHINGALERVNDCADLELVFSEFRTFDIYKENPDQFIMLALRWFRDVLIYKSTNNMDFAGECGGGIINSAKSASFKSLYLKIEGLKDFKRSISANTPFNTALDALAVKFKNSREIY